MFVEQPLACLLRSSKYINILYLNLQRLCIYHRSQHILLCWDLQWWGVGRMQTPYSNTLNWKQTLLSRNNVTVLEYSTGICPTKTEEYQILEIWQRVLYFISSKQKPFNLFQILPLWGSRGWGEEYAKIRNSTNIAPFSFFHTHDCFDYSVAKEITPDQDRAPAWQRKSRTGAEKDFLVLFRQCIVGSGSH